MVVEELVRFGDITEEALTWIRPIFFAFRYELICSAGVLTRLSVHGIGGGRHVLAETAEESWRFGVFPLDRREVPISREPQGDTIALFHRRDPPEVEFSGGPLYRLRKEGLVKTFLDDSDGKLIFTVEQVEAFPRWRAELKLEPDALALSQLPVLLASACCSLVFD